MAKERSVRRKTSRISAATKPKSRATKSSGSAGKSAAVSESRTDASRTELRRIAAAKNAEAVRASRRVEYTQSLRTRRVAKKEATTASHDGLSALRILAEGDSWFDFPFGGKAFRSGDVIARLKERLDLPILNEAVRGDEVRQLLGVEQRQRIEELLNDDELDFNVLLFSGGGNDIVGDAFCLWINDRSAVGGDPGRAVNQTAFNHALGVVRSGYQQLIEIRDQAARNTPGRSITLFLHAYDFARPTGKDVCGYGPWLKPSLHYRGWTNMEEGAAIVRTVLTGFRQMLEDLASRSTDVIVVDTQQALGPTDWNDELHPNRAGFGKIAERFHEAIRKRFSGA